MTHNVRKGGVPVLAYLASDTASPVSLSLVFKCNESPAQATLSLQSSLLVYGLKESQIITLQYDGDNLASCSLGPATIPLPQARLDQITRKGNPQIRTLSLTLKHACAVWHLPTSEPLAPRPGHETFFHQLSSLAKATKIHILFDYHWLHRETHAVFEQLVEHPEQLSAFPANRNFTRKYRRADWSVFDPPGEADTVDNDATTEDEEPLPSYAEARSKRSRHGSTSPTPSSPPPKRAFLSPFPEHAPTSPTEAGSITTPSPKPPYSPTALVPHLQRAVGKAISTLISTEKASSAAPNPKSTSFPVVSAPNFERAVEKAVSTMLPSMMEALLPSLLTVPSSPSPSLPASATSKPPSPTALSSLGNLLGARVARQVETQLQSIYNHTLSHAAWLRDTADEEFLEVLDERRLDLVMTKEDFMDEMDRAGVTKREEFLDQVEEVASDCLGMMANSANRVCDDAKQHLDDFAKEERARIQREIGWLGWEREVLERDKRKFENQKKALERSTTDGRSRRAGSAPA